MDRFIKFVFCSSLLFLASSVSFAQETKLRMGIGMEYFAADRMYDGAGEIFVQESTSFEFRNFVTLIYEYNKYFNLKLVIPYIYRKTEYTLSDYNQLGKGIGDIDLSNEIIVMENLEKGFSAKGALGLTIPTGTNNLKGELDNLKLPTGGPLVGSQGVFQYGGTYNLNVMFEAEKKYNKNRYGANVGYRMTFPVFPNEEKIDPGDIFVFGMDYKYEVNKDTVIGINYESFSSGRTEIGGSKLDYTRGIIGRINPNFTVELPAAKLNFMLKIPIFGRNEYKGLGYVFNIIF